MKQDELAGKRLVILGLARQGKALARFAAGILPDEADWLVQAAGAAWVLAFAGYATVYGAALLRHRPPS